MSSDIMLAISTTISPTSHCSYFAGRTLTAVVSFARFEGSAWSLWTMDGSTSGDVRFFMLGDSPSKALLVAIDGGAAAITVGAGGASCWSFPSAGSRGGPFVWSIGGEYCVPLSTYCTIPRVGAGEASGTKDFRRGTAVAVAVRSDGDAPYWYCWNRGDDAAEAGLSAGWFNDFNMILWAPQAWPVLW